MDKSEIVQKKRLAEEGSRGSTMSAKVLPFKPRPLGNDHDPPDDRGVARIWAGFIYLALRHGFDNDRCHGADLDLALVIQEAHTMQIACHIACEEADILFDELLTTVRMRLDEDITKKARRYFRKERRHWDEILRKEFGK